MLTLYWTNKQFIDYKQFESTCQIDFSLPNEVFYQNSVYTTTYSKC